MRLGWRSGLGIIAFLYKVKRKEVDNRTIDERLEKEIRDFYLKDVELLERLTGRKLNHWKKQK